VKIIVVTLFLFLIHITGYAQEQDLVFWGTLSVKGSKPYTYRIQFRDSANKITGFSVTDIQGPDQTRTAITGTIDPVRKEFSFRETRLISTRSRMSRDSFCYIHARLKLSEKKGARLLRGSFTGYMKDGRTLCGSGTMTLVSEGDVLDKLMKMGPKADTVVRLIEKADALATGEPAATAGKQHLTLNPGGQATLPCPGGVALLEVWDHGKIDGDIISLRHNDIILMEHYRIGAEREQRKILLKGEGSDRVRLIAEHEGAEPPVTVRLSCTCGKRTYTIDASSAIGHPVELVLKPE